MNTHRWLFQWALKTRNALIIIVTAGMLGGILTVLQARQLSQIVARVFLSHETLTGVRDGLVWLLLVILLRSLFSFIADYSAGRMAVQLKIKLREALFDHLLALGPSFTQGEQTGELANAALQGVESLDAYFSQYLPQIALAVLVPVIVLATVFPLDLLTALVLVLTAPLIPIFMVLIGKRSEELTKHQFSALSRMSAQFLDMLQGLTTLKQFNRSRQQAEKVASVSQQYAATTMDVLRVTFLSAFALELIATLSTAVVAVQIGLRLLYGGLEFEQAFFILIITPEFYLALRMLGTRYHAGMTGVNAARRIAEVLDIPLPDANINSGGKLLPELDRPYTLEFHQVGFSYPARNTLALDRVSFRFQSGQQIALVGASGSGKSTVVQLLLRFYAPRSGEILLNGTPLEQYDLEMWRNQVAWVSQTPHIFHASIAENLKLANPSASEAELWRALERAELADFVRSLPDGLETAAGEQGARLSGGQAQRLALARAFLKNAPFLILDEPTAHLDPEQETRLEDITRRLCQGRTVLVVAHRLRTIQNADQILVMDGGSVVEAGTHTGLMAQQGTYASLVQAAGAAL
jgi:ATP-binding cassette subfamily C protein CydD